MIGTVLKALVFAQAKDSVEAAAGKVRFSKTVMATHAGTAAGFWALIPLAMQGDQQAIGALVVMALGWAGALYGRWKADQG